MHHSLLGRKVTVIIFLCLIGLPFAGTFLRVTPESVLIENRRLAGFPTVQPTWASLTTFPARAEDYIKDNFGFRSTLIRGYNSLKVFWLHAVPNDQVINGKDGWYFYSPEAFAADKSGVRQISQFQVERWRDDFVAKKRFMEARGVKYLIVIVPDKQDVYPEFLPDSARRFHDVKLLSRFLAQLQTNGKLPILDLQPVLIAAKGVGRLYEKTDAHWNDLGALIAANSIVDKMRVWFPEIRPLDISLREMKTESGDGGDLAKMLGLQDKIREERIICSADLLGGFKAVPPKFSFPLNLPPIKTPSAEEAIKSNNSRVALVSVDSFGARLGPYLRCAFQRTVHLAPGFDASCEDMLPAAVEKEKPDIYIEEMVERYFAKPPEASPLPKD
jgi:alginate O-acetyltransferase complex protein AlgJ